MRKFIALLIVVIFIFGSLPSVAIAAVEKEKALLEEDQMEQLIQVIKAKLNIPGDYEEFSSSIDKNEKEETYRFYWSTPSYVMNDRGSIEVVVDRQGNVRSYYHYQGSGEYEYRRKLPALSKAQALLQAKKFIYFISPEIVDQLTFDMENSLCTLEFEGNYRFTFFRTYNGIPFYDNSISLTLNGRTGEVINFYRNWTEGLKFPDSKGVIKSEQAEKAYKEQIGLHLGYRRTYGEDQIRTYLTYSPEGGQFLSAIHAFSGQKVTEGEGNELYYDQISKEQMIRRELTDMTRGTQLNEKEMDELRREGTLISVEEAEKLARSMAELGLNERCRLQRYVYNKDSGNRKYSLRLEFAIPVSQEIIGNDIPEEKLKAMIAAGDGGGVANITFDAVTAEVIQYEAYDYNKSEEKKTTTLDRAYLQKKAEAFLLKYKKEKLNEIIFVEGSANSLYAVKYGARDGGSQNSFLFVRTVGGVAFEENYLELILDTATGKIMNYSEQWDNIAFISADHVIGLDKAYDILFKRNPMKLKYVSLPSGSPKIPWGTAAPGQRSTEMQLVYAPDIKKSMHIDAQKGILINAFNDQVFIAEGDLRYQDVSGHEFEKEIMTLADSGVLPADEKFRPEDMILQKEFLYMVAKVKYGTNEGNLGTGQMGQKEMDAMYRVLMNDNILDEAEKSPDEKVSREQAVKFLLKAMGYKKFAEIEGIFNTDYLDKQDIDSELTGYVAIARGLKLFKDTSGRFLPKASLTRADAAMMIYNGLSQ